MSGILQATKETQVAQGEMQADVHYDPQDFLVFSPDVTDAW